MLCGYVLESIDANLRTGPVLKRLHISFNVASHSISLTLGSLSFQGAMGTELMINLKDSNLVLRCCQRAKG